MKTFSQCQNNCILSKHVLVTGMFLLKLEFEVRPFFLNHRFFFSLLKIIFYLKNIGLTSMGSVLAVYLQDPEQ